MTWEPDATGSHVPFPLPCSPARRLEDSAPCPPSPVRATLSHARSAHLHLLPQVTSSSNSSNRVRTVPSTTSCCSSSSTRSTSSGSSSCCTKSDYGRGGLLERGNQSAARRCTPSSAMLTILKVMVAPARHPRDDDAAGVPLFRQRLDQASGFQSDQFRQFEFVLGFKLPDAVAPLPAGQPRLRPRSSAACRRRRSGTRSCITSPARATRFPPRALERDVTQLDCGVARRAGRARAAIAPDPNNGRAL